MEHLQTQKPNNPTPMKDPQHIMRGIDLLQAYKVKAPASVVACASRLLARCRVLDGLLWGVLCRPS